MPHWDMDTWLRDYGTVVVSLLVVIVLLALVSSPSRPGRALAALWQGPSVRDLFLTVRIARTGGGTMESSAPASVVHLRDLDLKGATLVSPNFLASGERVRLEMPPMEGAASSVVFEGTPGNAEPQGAVVFADVASSRRWRGAPDTWVVRVRFLPDAGRGAAKALTPYLQRLAGGTGRWSHA